MRHTGGGIICHVRLFCITQTHLWKVVASSSLAQHYYFQVIDQVRTKFEVQEVTQRNIWITIVPHILKT